MEVSEGVVKLLVPVPPVRTVPPTLEPYQSIVFPVVVEAVMATVPGPHLLPFEAVGAAGMEFTVATADALVVEEHPVDTKREEA